MHTVHLTQSSEVLVSSSVCVLVGGKTVVSDAERVIGPRGHGGGLDFECKLLAS